MRDNSITIFVDGKPYTVESSHANFSSLRQAILDARYDLIPELITIESKIKNITHGAIDIRDGKLLYDGLEIHGVVVDKLFEMLKGGAKDAEPLLNFIERLMQNPSANSIDQLYTFLSYKSLPITPDGYFLAYKGVKDDYYSKSGNKDTVMISGATNANAQIWNGVGEVIEVARRSVDDIKENHCSFGLHVGSYDYANSWAGPDGRLLVVEVDPADAVSVPTDCSFQKLRVSKYRVISDITLGRKEIPDAIYADDFSDVSAESDDSGSDKIPEPSAEDIENEFIKLKIVNYIDGRHIAGVYPTVKQIQSRMKGHDFSVHEILDIVVSKLGYDTTDRWDEHGDLLPVGQIQIIPKF